MIPDRFARIETLYQAARLRPPEARPAFLAEACGSDQDLRREVESLLAQPGVGMLMSNAVGGRPALASGTVIGTYRIVQQIGAGGMGEVYQAHDPTLGRDVAIKVLPQAMASDRDRSARLEREARLLAALNHANIAHIYGLEQFNGTRALVMELIEGDTLADRIAGGPIPSPDALAIAGQIAAALAAAHDHGIIHRDLKPANIKLRSEGTVKVLDFGLAKALGVGQDSTATELGSILGTAAYMSPEQATGKPVDRRTDLWAFGVVLMEMLTGRRVFDGDSVAHVLSAVLTSEPDWSALPPDTPLPVRRLLRRCLAKEPARRLDSAAAARLELDDASGKPSESVAASAPVLRMSRREVFAWGTAAALGIVGVTVSLAVGTPRSSIAPSPEIVFEIPSVRGVEYGDDPGFAVSPDGTRIAFVAANQGRSQLFVRSLNAVSASPVPGTAEASWPFWSPDSKSIGFFSNASLKRVDPTGGEPETIVTAGGVGTFRGATWTLANEIVFSPTRNAPLLMVRATGGDVRPVTKPAWGGDLHPFALPDGRHLLFTRSGSGAESSGVYVAGLDGSEMKRLEPGATFPAFLAPDQLLFIRGNALYVHTFDVGRLLTIGDAVRVADQVSGFSVSSKGVIAVRPLSAENNGNRLTWVDRAGKSLGIVGPADFRPASVELSRDGKRVVVHRDDGSGNISIWLLDLARGIPARLTFEHAVDSFPVWSPDGSLVIFTRNRDGKLALYEKPASGAEPEHLLLERFGTGPFASSAWSPDGRFLLFRVGGQQNGQPDLFSLDLAGGKKPLAWLTTPFDESNGQFAPDGRWVAYVSTETGRPEIYVQSYPTPGGKWQISTSGGAQPRWRADQKEMFYLDPEGNLMAAPITASPDGRNLESGRPVALFKPRLYGGFSYNARIQYVVSPDGQRFLLNQSPVQTTESPITVMVNWASRLGR